MSNYDPVFHVVLYEPEIPHNTGSAGRTCVAAGMKLWLVKPLGFRIDDYHLRRAGLDYWEHLEWEVVDDFDELKEKLDLSRAWFLTKKASHHYTDVTYQPGDVFIYGRESAGLPDWMLEEYEAQTLRVPIRPQTRSLNLSNTVGIVSFEGLRQINHKPGE